jgi:hypothetical protein
VNGGNPSYLPAIVSHFGHWVQLHDDTPRAQPRIPAGCHCRSCSTHRL